MTNFRPSASQALQKAFKRGRLQKVGTNYRLNADWAGGSVSSLQVSTALKTRLNLFWWNKDLKTHESTPTENG